MFSAIDISSSADQENQQTSTFNMKLNLIVLFSCVMAFSAATEEKSPTTGVDLGDQEMAEGRYGSYYGYRPYGYYNPYGYNNYYYHNYYRPSGYGHWRGRRSVEDQSADESNSRNWGYHEGSYYGGYRPSYYYGHHSYGHYPFYSYSYRHY